MKHTLIKKSSLAIAIAIALNWTVFAQTTGSEQAQVKNDEEVEVIEVTGIRSALASALAEKRSSSNIK